MTLIISHVFSEGLVCVTSDTMFRELEYSEEAYNPNAELKGKASEINKTNLLTDNVIASQGGLTLMTGIINKRLEGKVSKGMFIDDCIPLLHEVWEELLEDYSEDPFFYNNKGSYFYSYTLSGFYKNKKTGQVALSGGEIKEFVCENENGDNVSRIRSFVPTQDIKDISEQLEEPLYNVESLDDLFEQYKNVHAIVATIHPELVSKKIKILTLQNHNDEIVTATMTVDISEKVEMYKQFLNKNKKL